MPMPPSSFTSCTVHSKLGLAHGEVSIRGENFLLGNGILVCVVEHPKKECPATTVACNMFQTDATMSRSVFGFGILLRLAS